MRYLFRHEPWLGSRRTLSARGQFLRTFSAMGYCLVFSLLALGGYIMEEQFVNPLEAHPAGLLFSALLIAIAGTLLYLLTHSLTHPSDQPAPPLSPFCREDIAAFKRGMAPSCSINGSEQGSMDSPM